MSFTSLPVGELNIREAMLELLTRTAPDGAVVQEEMNVGCARVDAARIGDRIEGFEIKSDFDTLCRLPKQVVEYGQLFDSVTLVVGTVLFREAAELVPKWWGITLATTVDGSTVVLTEMRLATQNPHQNVEALTQLLWKDEARLALLELAGLRGATSESARALRSKVAKTIPFQIANPSLSTFGPASMRVSGQ